MDNVSQTIKSIRERKGIKQAEIAKSLGIERTNYHRLENRGVKLTIEQLSQIADALEVSISDLLDIENTNISSKEPERLLDLENRVVELKDRLKDKETLLENAERKLTQYKDFFEFYSDWLIQQKAMELKLGKIQIIDYDGKIIQTMNFDEYEKYELSKASKKKKLELLQEKVTLNKKEKFEVLDELMNYPDTDMFFMSALIAYIIDDEDFDRYFVKKGYKKLLYK
ncbi:helix-turn-helix domain-containing protein [Emticicia sp. C21]|uniref:helix-turn-helix domain-containing protein n=1 Tax=Emticicia sp. C21 TaxID=2302915 RepID=UPI000E3573D5|nr:helix-turn-helix transcriptional regulator [Emticicia sp. C21]RFS16094.1 XRE family transcriptional regulator [Emticicia sp. C21]